MPLKEVRWGILGVGDVCEVKAGPALQKADGSSLVAVMRRDAAKAEDFAKRHGVPRWYSDVDSLLADGDVDAVYVASPVGCHAEHALACLRAGKPTLLEKPTARCAEEAREVVGAFREAGVPLYSAYYRRAHPVWRRVKEMIDGGELGKITGVRHELRWERQTTGAMGDAGSWRLHPRASGGGLVMDVGSHAIDLIDYLLGPIRVAGGCASSSDAAAKVEDRVEAVFECGGVVGSASFDFTLPPGSGRADKLRISGTLGEVEGSVVASKSVVVRKGGGAAEEITLPPCAHVHQHLVQTVVDELLGKEGASCPSTAESGARANDVIDAAVAGFYGGREKGFWERS